MYFFDIKNDKAFKKVFESKKHVLIHFLNSVLERENGNKIRDVEAVHVEQVPIRMCVFLEY